MRQISSLNELKLPYRYEQYILRVLTNIMSDSRVDKVVLFGSCARGDFVPDKSDIDLLILTKSQLDKDEDLDFYDYLVYDKGIYVECDLIVMSTDYFESTKKQPDYIQRHIEKEGLILNGLLQYSLQLA